MNSKPTLLHVIDAFTDQAFHGNPAAVCVLDSPAEARWMQLVAREMNLAETSFLHHIEGGWSLRWFTPSVEVDLCGHATLAAAHALWETGKLPLETSACFSTRSGWLTCKREAEGWIAMDFPKSSLKPETTFQTTLETALGLSVLNVIRTNFDVLVEVSDESALRGMKPDFNALAGVPCRGVIVTCQSESPKFDFISRFFAPAAGIGEDPVTGSAHCALAPYWQAKLGKGEFTAFQASERGGVVKLQVAEDRVILCGQAVMMSKIELMN